MIVWDFCIDNKFRFDDIICIKDGVFDIMIFFKFG